MQDPPWKRMVDELRQRNFQSPYLERLRERLGDRLPPGAATDLAVEVLQEMASSLRRAEDKVNVALLELDVLGRRIDELAPGDPRAAALVVEFNAKRATAERALWELRVHREAVGFRREDLARFYPIPPKR
ncbi:MAG TPA: hypothetical protein VHB21_02220 [Minicystis sp.]|nr:hypothetical protein [Minicystis sp.]